MISPICLVFAIGKCKDSSSILAILPDWGKKGKLFGRLYKWCDGVTGIRTVVDSAWWSWNTINIDKQIKQVTFQWITWEKSCRGGGMWSRFLLHSSKGCVVELQRLQKIYFCQLWQVHHWKKCNNEISSQKFNNYILSLIQKITCEKLWSLWLCKKLQGKHDMNNQEI